MLDKVRARLAREPVAVRSAIVAVITAGAAIAGINVEDGMFQTVIGVVTVAVNTWLIGSARNKVTPVADPNLDLE